MPDEEDLGQTADSDAPATRPFWSGTITFGLVSIPVSLFPANRGSAVSLHMVGPKGERLKRRYYSQETHQDLSPAEIVRGYEIGRGKFVLVTDQELERLAPEKTRDIDLRRFVPYESIPKLFFERGYFLAPAGPSAKAYRLLAETMQKTNLAGIATFVMRDKEYIVAIIADNGLLRAETLRFSGEIRIPKDVGLPAIKKPTTKAVSAFEQIIHKASIEELPRHEMRNEAAQRLMELAEQKAKKKQDVVRVAASTESESSAPGTGKGKVVDLMAALQKALATSATAARHPAAPKKPASRRPRKSA